MSGLEEILEEAMEEDNNITIDLNEETDVIESDGYTVGECGKNETRKECMIDHINRSHGHKICHKDTPSVFVAKPREEALKKKVDLYKEAIRNVKLTNQRIVEDKQKQKDDKNKEIKKLEDDRDKFWRLHERSKDSYSRLQGLNVNRIHTVIENSKLKDTVKSSEDLLQQTLNANQLIKEENDLLKTTVKLLEEERDGLEEQIKPSDEEEDEISLARETPKQKCTNCDFTTKDKILMKGHQVKHITHKCNKCSKLFNSKESLNQHMSDKHPTNSPVGHSVWATQKNSDKENLKCSDCPHTFNSRDDLEKPYKRTAQ